MVKPPLRTKSMGFKVSEEEYAQLETAAQASRQTLGAFDNLIWPRLDTHIWPHLINKDGCPIRQSSSGFSQDGVQGKERRLSSFLCAAL